MHINCAVEAKLIQSADKSLLRTHNRITAVFCHDHLDKAELEIRLYGIA
jgi:hypothetical protein